MQRWMEIASRQWGVVRRDQLGLSDDATWRLIKDQVLIEVLPCVYRMVGTALTWHQTLMAAKSLGRRGSRGLTPLRRRSLVARRLF